MTNSAPRQRYAVIDNFMDDDELEKLRNYLKAEPFFFDNSFEWKKVWHPLDGQVLVTSPVSYGKTGRGSNVYPTGTAFDLFFDAMRNQMPEIERIVGRSARKIKFVASSYLYRAGWGLSWHNDAGPYCGAFAFYIHEHWRGNWGGELMIHPEERLFTPQPGSVDLGYAQGGGFEQAAFSPSGRGEFVMPLPNRLVLMGEGLLHAINPVSVKAGENMRFSVAGFFLR